MNRKLKCVIAALLVLVISASAVIILPATAAESGTAAPAPAPTAEGEVYAGSLTDKPDLLAVGADEDQTEPVFEEADGTVAATQAPTAAPAVDTDSVGAVTSAKRTTNLSDRMGLTWNAVPGAKGYRVYWRNADTDTDFKQLTTVKGNALSIRNLKAGAMYEFRVAAYKAVNKKLVEGEGLTFKAATLPTEVTNFRLTSGAPTGTVIKWNKNSNCDGYILYRQHDAVWSNYKTFGKDVTSFTDTDVTPGKGYYYKLYAYREDSTGVLKSDYVLLRTVSGLCAPGDNGTTSLLRKVYFKWKKNSYANGYEVMSSSDNKNFTTLTDTKNLYYTTDRLTDGKQYYFRVVPYRYVGSVKVYGTYMAKSMVACNSAYGKTIPKTYIEVNIAKQHMWYYIDDKVYVSTDVVTGNYNSMDTPKGYWAVNSKASPCTLVGPGYSSYVNYWMAFIGSGYGIHDASWRSSFGGNIYKGNGSHGCINTPYANVKKMYAKVTIGTPVIVY